MVKKFICLLLMLLSAFCSGRPIAHWRMNDDTNSTVVVDSQGYSNGISVQDTCDINTVGKINGALSFNGTSDYIDTNNTFQSVFQDSFSINLWFKITDGNCPLQSNFLYGTEGANHSMVACWVTSDSGVVVAYYRAADSDMGGTFKEALSGGVNPWIMLTVVVSEMSPISAKMDIYRDSVIQSSHSNDNLSMGDCINSYNLYYGALHGTFKFSGSIDDVRIYNKAISQAEVTCLYERGMAGQE